MKRDLFTDLHPRPAVLGAGRVGRVTGRHRFRVVRALPGVAGGDGAGLHLHHPDGDVHRHVVPPGSLIPFLL